MIAVEIVLKEGNSYVLNWKDVRVLLEELKTK